VHEILEKFFIEFNGRDMRTVTEKESKDALDRVLSKYNCGIISEDSTSRERGLYTRIERLVRLLTDNLRREFSVSAFAPYTFEMPIGKSGEGSDAKTVKALEIPVDEDFSVSLCGYIDRVDVLKKGDDAYVRVIDYKTGKKEFKRTDMELGINLQMPLYLQAFCEDENLRQELAGNGELLPAGVLYFAAGYPGIDSEDVDVTQSDDVYEKAVRSIKRNGLVFNDEEIIFAMDPEKKGEFIPVKYTKNGASGKALITKEEFMEIVLRGTDL
jgi:ATP-dependent helicase/nuclease subunit B